MIVVMPDGDDGWYTTWNGLVTMADCAREAPDARAAASYCVPWPHYDDYVARDLVARVDSAYRTAVADARGIAGLSMGGYGAISLALAYPDVFAAAASHSGVLSPLFDRPAPVRARRRATRRATADLRGAAQLGRPCCSRSGATPPGGGRATRGGSRARAPGAGRAACPRLMMDVGVADYRRPERALSTPRSSGSAWRTLRRVAGGARLGLLARARRESLAWLGARIGGAARMRVKAPFFPHTTVTWPVEQPPAFRRLSVVIGRWRSSPACSAPLSRARA